MSLQYQRCLCRKVDVERLLRKMVLDGLLTETSQVGPASLQHHLPVSCAVRMKMLFAEQRRQRGNCCAQETQNRQGSYVTYPLHVNEDAADRLMSGQKKFRVALPCAPFAQLAAQSLQAGHP